MSEDIVSDTRPKPIATIANRSIGRYAPSIEALLAFKKYTVYKNGAKIGYLAPFVKQIFPVCFDMTKNGKSGFNRQNFK